VLQSLSRLRSDELTAFFREVQQRIEHPWPAPFVILVQVGIVGTLVALRRFRHLHQAHEGDARQDPKR